CLAVGSRTGVRRRPSSVLHRTRNQIFVERGIILQVQLVLALLDLVERRQPDINMAALDQLRHLPVEEGQQQGADVRTIDVRIGHDDDAVVTQLVGIEFILADSGPQRGNQRADFRRRQHLVEPCLLDVENFSLERQDGLGFPVGPCFAEPPAESPSTRNNSDNAGSRSWQSASLPGRPAISSAPLRRVSSRALRAASRARAASTTLPAMTLASAGCSCRYSSNLAFTACSTTPLTSLETSLSLVCEENLGSGTLTDSTAIKPSRISSPDSAILEFLANPAC